MMVRAVFIHDTYYAHNKAGQHYAYGAFPYALWAERFLPHFNPLRIIGRDKGSISSETIIKEFDRSNGEHVSFCLLANINTPLKRLFGAKDVCKTIEAQMTRPL